MCILLSSLLLLKICEIHCTNLFIFSLLSFEFLASKLFCNPGLSTNLKSSRHFINIFWLNDPITTWLITLHWLLIACTIKSMLFNMIYKPSEIWLLHIYSASSPYTPTKQYHLWVPKQTFPSAGIYFQDLSPDLVEHLLIIKIQIKYFSFGLSWSIDK